MEEDAGKGVDEETDDGLDGVVERAVAIVRERVELPRQPHLPSRDREEEAEPPSGGRRHEDASDRPEGDAPGDGAGGSRCSGGRGGGFGTGGGEDARALAVSADPFYPRDPFSRPEHLLSTDPYRRLDPYRF